MKIKSVKLIFILIAMSLVAIVNAVPSSGEYEKLDNLSIYASSEYTSTSRLAENLINGSGLGDDGTHSTTSAHMWSSKESGATHHTLKLGLDEARNMVGMQLWNGNWTSYKNRGVNAFDIYYSTSDIDISQLSFEDARWKLLRSDVLAEASGNKDYKGEYKDLSSIPTAVTWIGIDIKSNHGGDFVYALLSEIELYAEPGAGVVIPKDTIPNASLENDIYCIFYNGKENTLELKEKSSSSSLCFEPNFQVIRNVSKPSIGLSKISEDFNYKTVSVEGQLDYMTSRAGNLMKLVPENITSTSDVITFIYPKQSGYSFTATLSLPETDDAEPELIAQLTPSISAYFSVGYYGAPAQNIDNVDEIFQPLPFTEKRFPEDSYLTPSFLATLPTTLATKDSITYGVVADASEFSFDPMPCTLARSEFGVAIRDNENKVRPMVWAPIIGNDDSKIEAGESYTFKYRLYLSKADMSSAYEDIARRLYGFGNYRHNALGSLNTALENMVKFAMGPYGEYKESMKGYSYETDIPNSVKNTSSIPILDMAFLLDDSIIFEDRAVPVTEFMLSRESFNYAEDYTTGTGQKAYNSLGDPCSKTTELMSFYAQGKQNSDLFKTLAESQVINASNLALETKWRESIAFYDGEQDDSYLSCIQSGADKYISDRINTKQTGFNYIDHSKSSFWSSLAPKFWEMFESYKRTGLERHLVASQKAARSYAYHIWLAPAVPDVNILCNKGNKAPNYRGGIPINISEEYAPAWRLSAAGLLCEAGGTSTSKHRGIFMANHAPYFMRIGALTGDQFLMDIAKAAMIGRWRSFPGYHMNTDRTTVYEKDDFCHRSIDDLLTTTSMHYSHVWPMIALTFDYLVSDVYARSGGAIDFPSHFIENTAYIYNNLYFKNGHFYGDDNVTLWMPSGLVTSSNKELNYIAARGNGKMYLAFTNQSATTANATITIDAGRVDIIGKKASVREDNTDSGTLSLSGNSFDVKVSANGITTVVIGGVEPQVQFQDVIGYQSYKNKWQQALEISTAAQTRAMIIGFSNEYTRFFAFSDAEKGNYTSVRFKVWFDGELQDEMTDTNYPFEYSEWVPRSVNQVRLKVTNNDGTNDEFVFERTPYTVSATVSGWTSIKQGQEAEIVYETDGEAPWYLRHSDGNDEYERTVSANSFVDLVAPLQTTSYKLVAVVDAAGDTANIVTSEAKVNVIDEFDFNKGFYAIQDAYVYQLGADNNYGSDDELKLRGKGKSQREIILKFDVSELERTGSKYLLGLHFTAASACPVMIGLREVNSSWDEAGVTWNTKPELISSEYIDTIGISEISPSGAYYYFDITDFIKNYTGAGMLSFSVGFLDGNELATLTFPSKEAQSTTVHPCIVSDVGAELSNLIVTANKESDLKIKQTPEELLILSPKNVKRLSVVDMKGVYMKLEKQQNSIATSRLEKGVYILVAETENRSFSKTFMVK